MPDATNSSRFNENFRGRRRKPTLQRMQALLRRSVVRGTFSDPEEIREAPKKQVGPAIMIGGSTPGKTKESNLQSGMTLRLASHKILESFDAFARHLSHVFIKYFTGG